MVLLTGDIVSGNFLFTDDNDSIGIYRQGQGPLRYVVYSDLITREETLAHPSEVAAVPEASLQRYLQLPDLDPQIYRLAEEMTEEQESRLDKALGIEYFLKGNYGYSLENQSAKAHDPLYDFLIETKAGHCEYFATAQAVLMRTIGIPTRVVNGFRLGEFNDFSDYFIVRQSDAHSWVEGYFPDLGWVEFDSTPSIDTVEPRLSFSRSFNQFLDAIDMFWTEIITFDRGKQIGIFPSLRFNLRDTWTRISDISLELTEISDLEWLIRLKDWDVSKVMYLVLGPLIIVILWAFRRYRRYFRILYKQWFFKQESWRIAPEYYLEMLDILNRKGFEKQAAETPH